MNKVHVYLANTDGSVLDWYELRNSTHNLLLITLNICIEVIYIGTMKLTGRKYEILIEKLEMKK